MTAPGQHPHAPLLLRLQQLSPATINIAMHTTTTDTTAMEQPRQQLRLPFLQLHRQRLQHQRKQQRRRQRPFTQHGRLAVRAEARRGQVTGTKGHAQNDLKRNKGQTQHAQELQLFSATTASNTPNPNAEHHFCHPQTRPA